MNWDVIVIGGGASGMMAAAVAGSLGKRVLLLEKNAQLGMKLRITGGGRCNITNAEIDTRKLLSNYGEADKFLFTPFSTFSNMDTFNFFEKKNLPLVVQARNRAFPISENAEDVYETLLKELVKNKVEIKTNCTVKEINEDKNQILNIETNLGIFLAGKYILATGGVSHKETGSTGDGFKFLKKIGHTVKDPTPSIVPLQVPESWIHVLSGTTIKNAKITFFSDKKEGVKKEFSKIGDILFTHFGLSGPTILNSASKIGILLQSGIVTAEIDAFPKIDHGQLDKNITAIFDQNKNKLFKTVLKEIVPEGMSKGIEILLAGKIDMETRVHSVSKEQRKDISQLLKKLPLTVTNLMGFDKAVVADGGVELLEIDMKTFTSKKYENLFIIGDLLNINKPSGGFSLQLCWTSGFIAGSSI